eukprot:10210184-Lingulodinium_polyedra.AAC.1
MRGRATLGKVAQGLESPIRRWRLATGARAVLPRRTPNATRHRPRATRWTLSTTRSRRAPEQPANRC